MDTADTDELGNELCAAALAGDIARARQMLKAGAKANHAFVGDEFLRGEMHEHLCWPGNSPLAEAIRAGQVDIVRLLVDAGADPNAPVAAAFGPWPDRVKDRPLTWWMRFALEYQIQEGSDRDFPTIRPSMLPVGCMLLAKGSNPCLGAITSHGTEGPGMDAMMAREGLARELDQMRATASQNELAVGTVQVGDVEQAIDRL